LGMRLCPGACGGHWAAGVSNSSQRLLEGLARSGPEACLDALRKCAPAHQSGPCMPQTPASARARTSADLVRGDRSPSAPGQRDALAARGALTQPGPAGQALYAPHEHAEALAAGSPRGRLPPAAFLAAGEDAPACGAAEPEQPQRPAWLEQAALRVVQGVRLCDCAHPQAAPASRSARPPSHCSIW